MSSPFTHVRTVTAEADRTTIAFRREFDAPAALVFRAHTEADLVARWIGPRGTTLRMREFDARTGGSWSYVVEAPDGAGWGFHGSFHEVSAPTRLVQTFEYDGEPGHPNLEILTFVDLGDDHCRLEGLSVFPTVEARDAMLADMDGGMDENFQRLDALLPDLG